MKFNDIFSVAKKARGRVAKRLGRYATLAVAALIFASGPTSANTLVQSDLPAVTRAVGEAESTGSALSAAAPIVVATREARQANKLHSPSAASSISQHSKASKRSSRRNGGVSDDARAGRTRDAAREWVDWVDANQVSKTLLQPKDVPRPWLAGSRARGRRITDSAALLRTQGARDAIMETIRTAESETGTEMVVVTLPSIGGQSPKRFATELFNEWRIGNHKKNNGVLVLVIKDARRVEVEVGDGAEGKFSKSWTEDMLADQVLPYFKSGDYSTGLQRCVKACADRLSYDATVDNIITGGVFGLYLLGVITGVIPAGSGGSGGGSGSSSGRGGGGGSW